MLSFLLNDVYSLQLIQSDVLYFVFDNKLFYNVFSLLSCYCILKPVCVCTCARARVCRKHTYIDVLKAAKIL